MLILTVRVGIGTKKTNADATSNAFRRPAGCNSGNKNSQITMNLTLTHWHGNKYGQSGVTQLRSSISVWLIPYQTFLESSSCRLGSSSVHTWNNHRSSDNTARYINDCSIHFYRINLSSGDLATLSALNRSIRRSVIWYHVLFFIFLIHLTLNIQYLNQI